MFKELVTVKNREGTLIVYNLADGEYKFLYDSCEWNKKVLSSHKDILEYLDYCGLEHDDLDSSIMDDFDCSNEDTIFFWLEA